jgi:YfiH family protein
VSTTEPACPAPSRRTGEIAAAARLADQPGLAQAAPLTAEVFDFGYGAGGLFTSTVQGNLSSVGGRLCERGAEARLRLRDALGVRRIVRGYQVHGTVIGHVHADLQLPGAKNGLIDDESLHTAPTFEADGHAVAAPGIAAMALTADCVPVLLSAEGAVAALHAGWRGMAMGVIEAGLRALREVGGEGRPAAAIGPCAGVCCYEVGEEVHAAFGEARRDGRKIDLRAIARERLRAAGVFEVHEVEACTVCDERYYSFRREGAQAGRQAGLAWLS